MRAELPFWIELRMFDRIAQRLRGHRIQVRGLSVTRERNYHKGTIGLVPLTGERIFLGLSPQTDLKCWEGVQNLVNMYVDPSHIVVNDFFGEFLARTEETLARVEKNMKENGFDDAEPLIVAFGPWTNADVLVDGHVRRTAAIKLGLMVVPVRRLFFRTEEKALKFMFHRRFDRHAHSDADILRAVEVLETRCGRLQEGYWPESEESLPRATPRNQCSMTAEQGAEIVGIDVKQYKQCMAILTCPDGRITDSILRGELTVGEKFARTGKQSIRERVVAAEVGIEEAYRQVRLFAARLHSAREEMKEGLIGGKEIKVPQYWLDEGWWPPTREEIEECRKRDKESKPAPMSVTIPRPLRRRLEALGGSPQDHVVKALELYLDSLEKAQQTVEPEFTVL